MIFPESLRSTAILILSASLSAVPSFAQATNTRGPSSVNPPISQPAPITGKVVEDIVARVNDQIVTQSDYDRAAQQLDSESKQQAIPAPELEKRHADLLRDLIDQQLLLSKGKELGITGETELVKKLDEIRKQNHLDSLDDLEKAAQQQGVSYEDFKANIRNGIITQQVVRDEVGRRITMSPPEVQRYYKEHESEFAQPESVNLNEILIPTPAAAGTEAPDPAQVAAAQAQADAISAKLAAGAKFEDVATAASTGPNAAKSVTLGEFRRGMLAKEIEDKAFALNAGQYTQPIRTKQGFIILQVAEHTLGGDAGFKQVEPQVEEALFMQNMQPKLREYLTKLRGEAFVEIKPGAVDTGSNGNEMRLTYSAYTPPPAKKKKKFQRTRFRGKTSSAPLQTASTKPPAAGSAAGAASAAVATAATPAATAATAAPAGTTQQASNANQNIQSPGKREKIRFGQAPRESLPAGQVATAGAPPIGPDATAPSGTTPETRFVNPDGTVSSTTAAGTDRKTRLSNRAPVPKSKRSKSADATDAPTPDELAAQKVQNAPLGLADQAQAKKTKQKGDKTRYSAKPKAPEQTPQPYLGSQPASSTGQPAATPPATSQPAPSSSEPAPSTGPPAAQPPGATQP
jgi:peptidyl-prolyl cis-trans isomerase SurA